MGQIVVGRTLEAGHDVVAFDLDPEAVADATGDAALLRARSPGAAPTGSPTTTASVRTMADYS